MNYEQYLNSLSIPNIKKIVSHYNKFVKIVASKKTKEELIQHLLKHTDYDMKTKNISIKKQFSNLQGVVKEPKVKVAKEPKKAAMPKETPKAKPIKNLNPIKTKQQLLKEKLNINDPKGLKKYFEQVNMEDKKMDEEIKKTLGKKAPMPKEKPKPMEQPKQSKQSKQIDKLLNEIQELNKDLKKYEKEGKDYRVESTENKIDDIKEEIKKLKRTDEIKIADNLNKFKLEDLTLEQVRLITPEQIKKTKDKFFEDETIFYQIYYFTRTQLESMNDTQINNLFSQFNENFDTNIKDELEQKQEEDNEDDEDDEDDPFKDNYVEDIEEELNNINTGSKNQKIDKYFNYINSIIDILGELGELPEKKKEIKKSKKKSKSKSKSKSK